MTTLRTILVLIVAVAVTIPSYAQIRWSKKGLLSALQIAGKEGKHVFVDTYTTTCIPCKVMDKNLLDRDLSDYFNTNLVSVKIDMNSPAGRAIKDKYDLVFLPTLMVLAPDGSVKYKVDKVIPATELLYKVKLTVEKNVHFEDASIVSNSPMPSKQSRSTRQPTVIPQPQSSTLPPAKGETSPDEVVSDEKVLYVLDGKNGDVPPEILRAEAYFRMELGDGTHRAAARKYLDTQTDWSTRENLQFVYDFLYDGKGELFDYFVEHREDFVRLVGPTEVARTTDILVRDRLERGYPRPALDEAKWLYTLQGSAEPAKEAFNYCLDVMLSESRELTYLELIPQYLSEIGLTDHRRIHEAATVFIKNGRPPIAASTSDYISWLEYAITLSPDKPYYLQTLSHLYLLSDDKPAAKAHLRKAIDLAQAKGIDFTPDKKILRKVGEL